MYVHVSWESARDTLTAKWDGNGFRSPGKNHLSCNGEYVLSSSRHLVTLLIYIRFCVWLGLFVDRWWLKEVWFAPDFLSHFSACVPFAAPGITGIQSKRICRGTLSKKTRNWSIWQTAHGYVGIPTTVRKTEVRTTPVRSHECECQQCEETTVRMRQKCEGQVCEGQECECDFSAIGQNSKVIQIERSRSFCLQDVVFSLSLFLSQSLSFSLGLYVRVRIRVGSLSPTDRQKTARESRSE